MRSQCIILCRGLYAKPSLEHFLNCPLEHHSNLTRCIPSSFIAEKQEKFKRWSISCSNIYRYKTCCLKYLLYQGINFSAPVEAAVGGSIDDGLLCKYEREATRGDNHRGIATTQKSA